MRKERKSTVEVTPLVFSEDFCEGLWKQYKESKSDEESKFETVRVDGFDLGYIKTSKGIFVIDQDGVGDGDPHTKENPLEIDFVGSSEGKINLLAIPIFSIRLVPEQIEEFGAGETVNLAKFIRTFGQRLEGNFHTWNDALSPLVKE
jgi:hypothetical protein